MSRITNILLMLGSLGILAGVAYYFTTQFEDLENEQEVFTKIRAAGDSEGPCAALGVIRKHIQGVPDQTREILEARIKSYAGRIVGNDNTKARRVFAAAEREGLIDYALCEQIQMVHQVGEAHPVLDLLKLTHGEANPCDEVVALEEALSNIGKHRVLGLRALIRKPERLLCLPARVLERIAAMIIDTAYTDPRVVDDMDPLTVGSTLQRWAPVQSAQLGCYLAAREEVSRLGTALACPDDARSSLLGQYAIEGDDAGARYVVVRRSGSRCDVVPAQGKLFLQTKLCQKLKLQSDLHVAVRAERIEYGVARADLIVGLATYVGSQGETVPPKEAPSERSWYSYDRYGNSMGRADEVNIRELGSRLGEAIPERALSAYCSKIGAAHCYDVEWAQTVHEMGEALVYLSRPSAEVFLSTGDHTEDEAASIAQDAMGKVKDEGAAQDVYELGADGFLVVRRVPGTVRLAWKLPGGRSWSRQSFGEAEGGRTPPLARLYAALDLGSDGRPEIVMQRIERQQGEDRTPQKHLDQLILLQLNSSGRAFQPLHQLTIHEY